MRTLGIDYGTHSVRTLFVDVSDGRELATCVVDYPSGKLGIFLDPRDANFARQHPGDYVIGLEKAVRGALEQASKEPAFSANEVIGIGVDTTGSSPLPIEERNVPLGLHEKWNLAAVLAGPDSGSHITGLPHPKTKRCSRT